MKLLKGILTLAIVGLIAVSCKETAKGAQEDAANAVEAVTEAKDEAVEAVEEAADKTVDAVNEVADEAAAVVDSVKADIKEGAH